VVDKNNTAGFGKNALVAIFTQHSHAGENAGRNDFQNQGIAYSLDKGETWTKYSGNPVLKNPGIKDFRDPKVSWHEPTKKWIMTLAVLNKVSFYSSPDLKRWTLESSFGENAGAHGGVWECPDLFFMEYEGRKHWVLLVSLNPGGPNGGSATQYFIGDFDGKNFTTTDTATRWIDYGPDNYAGVTWSNTGRKKLFIGWMSNWSYATTVPTETWRSAMTMTRELKLVKENDRLLLASSLPGALKKIKTKPVKTGHLHLDEAFDVTGITGGVTAPAMINLTMDAENDFVITMNNTAGDELLIGYDKKKNQYYLDRSRSGKTDFSKAFAAVHTAPRLSGNPQIKLSLLIDAASIEVFADDGLTVMTQIFFTHKPFEKIFISSPDHAMIRKLEFARLESIWK
jgi:fructan beta-fructosidase